MNLTELLQLAAVVVARAPRFINDAGDLPPDSLECYWAASKCRHERWARSLKLLSLKSLPEHAASPVHSIGAAPLDRVDNETHVLREILVSEVLSRVWTAILAAHDKRHEMAEAEPVARNVLTAHQEARHRALTLLVRGTNWNACDANELNRLRRQAERWNDMLIGHLLLTNDASEFAFDVDLAREFADDFRGQSAWQEQGAAWSLLAASLRGGFRGKLTVATGNEDLNAQIGAAILCCLEHDLFDSFELPKSLWAARLFQTTDTAQNMIEKLFAAERRGFAASRL
jgi:hypothetical protein